MPITLAEMTADVATVTFEWGENEVNVTYHPGKVTEQLFTQLGALENLTGANVKQAMEDFNATLADIVSSWDVLEGKTMFPIDPKRFPALPLMFRMRVASSIVNDIRPENLAPQAKTKNS